MTKKHAFIFVIRGNSGVNTGEFLWANHGFDNMRVAIVVSAVMFFHGTKYILNCLKKQGEGGKTNEKEVLVVF